MAPVYSRLLDISVIDYRQGFMHEFHLIFDNIDNHNSEGHLLALIDSGQNIQKLLFERVLLS